MHNAETETLSRHQAGAFRPPRARSDADHPGLPPGATLALCSTRWPPPSNGLPAAPAHGLQGGREQRRAGGACAVSSKVLGTDVHAVARRADARAPSRQGPARATAPPRRRGRCHRRRGSLRSAGANAPAPAALLQARWSDDSAARRPRGSAEVCQPRQSAQWWRQRAGAGGAVVDEVGRRQRSEAAEGRRRGASAVAVCSASAPLAPTPPAAMSGWVSAEKRPHERLPKHEAPSFAASPRVQSCSTTVRPASCRRQPHPWPCS